jgi:hypothetical protein
MKQFQLGALCFLFTSVAFSANAAPQSGATFHAGKNYSGESTYLPEAPTYHEFLASENDLYKSITVGELSKVFAWQHYGATGVYREYTTSNPDVTDIRGLSVVKVVPKDVQGVAIRLIDNIGTGKLYCLSSKVYGAGAADDVYSCTDNQTYQLVGTINPTLGGESIVASIAVRNMQPGDANYGVYINNGSVYFKSKNNDVWVSKEGDEFNKFPKNLDIVEVAPNRFDVYITSETPDFGV